MKRVEACSDDGYLANGHCPTVQQWVPMKSHFSRVTPYHQEIHLDRHGWRVNGGCESVARMVRADWFVLAPAEEHYYRMQHSDYLPLPRVRPDCARTADNAGRPISILYPTPGTRVYIPVDLDGRKSKVVFKAVHRDADAVLYWHIDQDYLGSTRTYHQEAVRLAPGRHLLTLVDQKGNRVSEWFTVLKK